MLVLRDTKMLIYFAFMLLCVKDSEFCLNYG